MLKQSDILITGGTGMVGAALQNLIPDANFDEALKKTCKWYIINYPKIRGIS